MEQVQGNHHQNQQQQFSLNQDTMSVIVQYLKECQIPDNKKQQQVYQKTQEYVQNPEFFMYLATIMSHSKDFPLDIRLYAAVTLQSLINQHFDRIRISPQALSYVKNQIYQSFNDQSNSLCSKIGNIVTVIIQHEGFSNWPEILDFLFQNLLSDNQHSIEVTIACVAKIVEDLRLNYENYSHLDSNHSGKKLNLIIPKLLEFCTPRYAASVRSKTIYCLNICVDVMPEKFEENLPYYCDMLLKEIYDENSQVRLRAVQGITAIMETSYQSYFEKTEEEVVKGIATLSGDNDYQVAKFACSFWMEYIQEYDEEEDQRKKTALVSKYLHMLIPAIVKGMRFTDEDLLNQLPSGKNYIKSKQNYIEEGEEEQLYQHQDQMLKQDNFASQQQQDLIDKDFFDHGEDTLRRICGILLQKFASIYRDKIFTIVQPFIGQLFQSQDWRDQEMGILTLGCVAESSFEEISQHLPTIFPQLMHKMQNSNEFQLLSTVLWTLSKFTSYIVQIAPQDEATVKEYLQAIVKGILHCDIKVQESSCYSLKVLIDQGCFILQPFLLDIIKVFSTAITSYNGQSVDQLYEAIYRFVEEMQDDFLLNEEASSLLLEQLVSKFHQLSIEDSTICPVAECLAQVADFLDRFFAPFVKRTFEKAYSIYEDFLTPQFDTQSKGDTTPMMTDNNNNNINKNNNSSKKANEFQRKEVFIRIVEVLSTVIFVAKENFVNLAAGTNFMDLLTFSLDNSYSEVKQFVASLIGELVKNCPQIVEPKLENLVKKIATFVEFHPRELDPEGISNALCNNAVWCLCEFCFAFRNQLQPFAFQIAQKLVEFLNTSEQIDKAVARNFCKAIGKLGCIDPQQISQLLDRFIKPFCLTLRQQKEDSTYAKGEAFHGLFKMIQFNPQAALQQFQYVIECFVNYGQATQDLKNEFLAILMQLKQTMDEEQWEKYLKDPKYFTPGFRNKVLKEYNM